MDCKACGSRFRADKLIERICPGEGMTWTAVLTLDQMDDGLSTSSAPCPVRQVPLLTDIRQFNLMFKTFQGVTEDSSATVYLVPRRTAFSCQLQECPAHLPEENPFRICQIGKSFRNEITRHFTFVHASSEMELEFSMSPTQTRAVQILEGFLLELADDPRPQAEETRIVTRSGRAFLLFQMTGHRVPVPFGWVSCGASRTGPIMT